MEKDEKKIVHFLDKKREKEKEQEQRNQKPFYPIDTELFESLFSQSDEFTKEKVGELLGSFGIEMDEDMKRQIFEMIQSNDFQEMIRDVKPEDLYSGVSLDKITKNTKEINDKMKNQYRMYREIGQWQNVYKPYTLDKFLLIEHARFLADKMKIDYSPYESKNQIIEKIKPELPEYLKDIFALFDQSRMQKVGDIVLKEGIHYMDHILTEAEEKKIDYFQGLHIMHRINDHSQMALVIPQEILHTLYLMNFKEVELWNQFNTAVIKLMIGMGNAYGVFPAKDAIALIRKYLHEEKELLFKSEEEFVAHLYRLSEDSFGNMFSRSYYDGVKLSKEYLFHSAVGLPQEYARIQRETMEKYRDFSYEELIALGEENYYENSVFLETVWEIIEGNNSEGADENLVKQMSYIFAKAEFEPQLVLTFLSTVYNLPGTGSSYQIMLTTLRALSKSVGKWMLGGFPPGESANLKREKLMNKDVSKIVDMSFYKRNGDSNRDE